MTKQEIIKIIDATIVERFEIDPAVISPDANIRHTLQLDSMSVLEIIVLIKKQFGFIIPKRDLPRFVTFDDLYDYIVEHQQ